MARKQFTVPSAEEQVEFDLEGKTFRCRPRVSAGILMRFADVAGGPEDEVDSRAMVRVLREFFVNAIVREDFDEFWGLIEDPDIAIPVETLSEIANWLAEQYTERPTGGPSSSGRGSGSSGGVSTAVVYSRESISSTSPQDER